MCLAAPCALIEGACELIAKARLNRRAFLLAMVARGTSAFEQVRNADARCRLAVEAYAASRSGRPYAARRNSHADPTNIATKNPFRSESSSGPLHG